MTKYIDTQEAIGSKKLCQILFCVYNAATLLILNGCGGTATTRLAGLMLVVDLSAEIFDHANHRQLYKMTSYIVIYCTLNGIPFKKIIISFGVRLH